SRSSKPASPHSTKASKRQSSSTGAPRTSCSWNCSPNMALARLFTRSGAFAALAAVASLGALAFAGTALAQQQRAPNGWQICNETTYVLEAATARPDGRSIQVQGWTRLRPGECRVAVAAPLARGTHYLYARTSSAHRGGRQQWTGDARLCVDPTRQFQIENPPRCTD